MNNMLIRIRQVVFQDAEKKCEIVLQPYYEGQGSWVDLDLTGMEGSFTLSLGFSVFENLEKTREVVTLLQEAISEAERRANL